MAFTFAQPMPSLPALKERRDALRDLALSFQPPPMFTAADLGLNLGAAALRQWAAQRAESRYQDATQQALQQLGEAAASGDTDKLLPLALAITGPEGATDFLLKDVESRRKKALLAGLGEGLFGPSSPAAITAAPAAAAPATAKTQPSSAKADDGPSTEGAVPLTQLAWVESGGGANTANPLSNAMGKYQITPATWAEYAPKVGAPAEYDPAFEDRVAVAAWQDYQQRARADLGREPTGPETYAYWFLGPGDAPKVLKGSEDADVEGIVSPQSYAANPFLHGMSVRQAKEELARRWNAFGGQVPATQVAQADTGALSDVGTARSWLDSLTPQQRQYLQRLFEVDPEEAISIINRHAFEAPEKPAFQEVQVGNEIVTYQVQPDGQLKEIARAPRFQPSAPSLHEVPVGDEIVTYQMTPDGRMQEIARAPRFQQPEKMSAPHVDAFGNLVQVGAGGEVKVLAKAGELADKPVFQQIPVGDEIVTYRIMPGNQMQEVARAPRFQPPEQMSAPHRDEFGNLVQVGPGGKVNILAKASDLAAQAPQGPLVTLQFPDGTQRSYHQDDPEVATAMRDRGAISVGTAQTQFEIEKQLRSEFERLPEVQAFKQIVPIVESARESVDRDTRAADLNIVYAVGKVMDPSSVVREGEQMMVINSGSLPQWAQGVTNYVLGGGRLTQEQRHQLLAEIESRAIQWEKLYQTTAQRYTDLALSYRLTPERIVQPLSLSHPDRPVQQGGEDLYERYGLERPQ